MKTPVCYPESSPSVKGCSSPELRKDSPTEQIDLSKLKSADDTERLQESGSSPEKLDADKVSGTSVDRALTSSEDATNALDCATGPGLQAHTGAKSKDLCVKTSSFNDVHVVESAGKRGISDCGAGNDYRSTVVFRNKEGGNFSIDESGTFLSRMEGVGEIDRVEDHVSDKSDDHHVSDKSDDLPINFAETELHSKDPEVIQKKSDTDLDYDIDALEVARLVAIEVEKEVNFREHSSCSSDRVPGGEIQHPDSPVSTHGPQSYVQEDSSEEVPTAPDLSAQASPPREEEPAVSSGSLDDEPINGAQEMEYSQVTDVAQELPSNTGKGVCNFDLNQEVCSEDVDRLEKPISTPISIVSASRAAAAPGLPIVPLQFEGALGWKGSAATSAFRPASPRRIPEADKTHSTGGSNSSSKQRHGCLDIDLNIDESVEEKITDSLLEKQIPVSSGLPSGESSVEASSRRSERIELDLNRASDDGDAPSDWRTEGLVLHQRNGNNSQSPSSSSSSKQPSLKNIDLNDQPSFANESSGHPFLSKLSQSFLNAPCVKRSDESVISIMGMKVEVNRKDFVPQPLPLLNGRSPEPDVNLAKSGGLLGMGSAVPFTHSPLYGYNGLASGATMAFSSAIYGPSGPIPYMLDSRGAPVAPQVMGSASALPPVFSHTPFMMSMSGTPVSKGAVPSQNSFDLNSGMILDGGNRDTGGLRQLLNPGQTRLMDDHLKSNSSASTSSGGGLKRREPESGWEPYPFKHNPSPWK
ncbi:hypothetical protein ACH5RR_035254 [Cinchona calisaya]|uniref:Uncharacterized protein n=1 Tax=Cinchona calisaya TaxID=153742 RepID=A0ABD2YIN8_9GENT